MRERGEGEERKKYKWEKGEGKKKIEWEKGKKKERKKMKKRETGKKYFFQGRVNFFQWGQKNTPQKSQNILISAQLCPSPSRHPDGERERDY